MAKLTAPVTPAPVQLAGVVEYLEHDRGAILRDWKARVKADPVLSTASQLTFNDFLNGIPDWLDALSDRLLLLATTDADGGEGEVAQQGREHGSHRWRLGYNLREVTCEWGHLHNALEDALEAYRTAHQDLAPGWLHRVRRALRDAINGSINESVMQYNEMQQDEAALHVRDLERALTEVNELDRLRGEALRAASHDLRGSLTVVRGATQMLDEVHSESARAQLLNLVERSIASLNKMINDLMDLARLEAGQEARTIRAFDAAPLLQDLCGTSLPLAVSSDLFLHAAGPASLPVAGDDVKVRRIAQNLLLNALKFTEHGGVTVSWLSDSDATWSLRVADTGPGLNGGPNPHPEVPVERRAVVRQGEGIGLSIVRRLCELLDARLAIDTHPDTGSAFTIVFPRRYDSAA